MDPAGDPILQFFTYGPPLPEQAQPVARLFAEVAERVASLPRHPERAVALRYLLEARDAAVRASTAVR